MTILAFIVVCLDIRAEMMPDTLPDRSEVKAFDQSKLKHVETQEKEVLPTKAGLRHISSFLLCAFE